MATTDQIPALRRVIVALQRNGYSMRAGLQIYRGGGGSIRTEDFAAIWRDEQRKREAASTC